MKFYDRKNKRLIFFYDKKLKKNYWDEIWLKEVEDLRKKVLNFRSKSLVCKITPKYVHPNNGPLLEGGCGLGNKVFNLKKMGFDVIGIDFARETINLLQKKIPELNIQYGDVRKLGFPDNYFSGYWSLGVIEHFYEGYMEVLNEMHRVLKPKGILFITFPYMSPLRLFKAKLNFYNPITSKVLKENLKHNLFYQFALNEQDVIRDFEKSGFKLLEKQAIDGIKGLKDEIFIFKFYIRRLLRLLYNTKKSKILKIFNRFLDKIIIKFSAHIRLLIFQKIY